MSSESGQILGFALFIGILDVFSDIELVASHTVFLRLNWSVSLGELKARLGKLAKGLAGRHEAFGVSVSGGLLLTLVQEAVEEHLILLVLSLMHHLLSLKHFRLLQLVQVLLNDVEVVHTVLLEVLLEAIDSVQGLDLLEVHGVLDDGVGRLHDELVAVEPLEVFALQLALSARFELRRDALGLVLLQDVLLSQDILNSFVDLGLLVTVERVLHCLELRVHYEQLAFILMASPFVEH